MNVRFLLFNAKIMSDGVKRGGLGVKNLLNHREHKVLHRERGRFGKASVERLSRSFS